LRDEVFLVRPTSAKSADFTRINFSLNTYEKGMNPPKWTA
jgi:hypothetical protein